MSFNFNMGDPFGWVPNANLSPFNDATGLTEIDPTLSSGRNFIALIYGQSLASSHIAADYEVRNPTKINMVNWAGDHKLYQHKEPMFGGSFFSAGETHGVQYWPRAWVSLWGAVGDLLIERDYFDRVIWANYSSGGSTVIAFQPGGAFGLHTPTIFNVLRKLGYGGNQVSAVLGMIGESDSGGGTTTENYKIRARAHARAVRSYGFTGPWFVPKETFRQVNGNPADSVTARIQQAQMELWGTDGFVQGPDFDSLGFDYRDLNGTHQNALGMTTMAGMWADYIGAHFT